MGRRTGAGFLLVCFVFLCYDYSEEAIDSCYRLREKADYDDFFLVAKDDAVLQLEKARKIVSSTEQYITEKRQN